VVGVSVVRRPARTSVALAVLPGLLGSVALATTLGGLVLGLAGLAVVAAGATWASRPVVTAGALVSFLGVVFAALAGVSPGFVLVGAAGAVVTWTTAQHVVGLGEQLGRDARVVRSVVVHLAVTAGATLVAGGATLAVFLAAEGSFPATAVVFLLAGVALLLGALEP